MLYIIFHKLTLVLCSLFFSIASLPETNSVISTLPELAEVTAALAE